MIPLSYTQKIEGMIDNCWEIPIKHNWLQIQHGTWQDLGGKRDLRVGRGYTAAYHEQIACPPQSYQIQNCVQSFIDIFTPFQRTRFLKYYPKC